MYSLCGLVGDSIVKVWDIREARFPHPGVGKSLLICEQRAAVLQTWVPRALLTLLYLLHHLFCLLTPVP